MLKHVVTFCLIVGGSSVLTAAQSSDTTDGWNLHEFTMTFTGSAVPKDIRGKPFPAETIFTNSDDVGDVALTCLYNKLSSTIEVKKTDFKAVVMGQSDTRRARYRETILRINGEKVSKGRWTYVPKYKVLLAQRQSDKYRLYNAAIAGDSASVQIGYGDIIELNLPKMDKTFAEFGAACNLGNKKQK